MCAEVAVLGAPLAISITLSGPPPARGKARTRRVREVDDDKDAVPVTRLSRRGVRVPPAGEPDPVHTQSVDRKEADPPGFGGVRDVVHHEARALRDADAIGVLLVIGEQKAVGELHLVRMRSLRHGDLPEDSRAGGIGDVDDAGPDAEIAHVTDVEDLARSHDLHPVAAAAEVGVADELDAVLLHGTGMDGGGHRRAIVAGLTA